MINKNPYIWGHPNRYNDFSTYFRQKFPQRLQKISIDAGFTCPNRDGTKGRGGCTYCNNSSFSPDYCNSRLPVSVQIKKGIEFFSRKYPSMEYLAYFQAYTNTYAPLEKLVSIYEEALNQPGVVGLVISTRPDAINTPILDYLEELSKRVYVMVEFGVESHLNRSLISLNRGHTFEESVDALKETDKRGILNCAHLIIGIPGENYQDWLDQARVVGNLPVQNLKLHQLQIHKGTVMAVQYARNPNNFKLIEKDEYVEIVVDYLELLNPNIIVERFVSQAPKDMLIAPKWNIKNYEITAMVERRLKERNTWQGRLWKRSKYSTADILK